MPPLEQRFLEQFAVLWLFSGYDSQGQATVSSSPVQVPCRWVDKRIEVLQPDGNVIAFDAVVVTAQSVHVGSIMWKGTLSQFYGTGTGTGTGFNQSTDLFEVKENDWTPDIRNRCFEYELKLMRYRETLPTQTG